MIYRLLIYQDINSRLICLHKKYYLLRIRYEFVDIMREVNPDYKPYVKYENGKKVLYVKVMRAIYGCIESALLW